MSEVQPLLVGTQVPSAVQTEPAGHPVDQQLSGLHERFDEPAGTHEPEQSHSIPLPHCAFEPQ